MFNIYPTLMKIAYNVSTVNYLWQAENLAKSFLHHNPDYKFIVCLIDKPSANWNIADYQFSFDIIWIGDLQVPTWDKMVEYYTFFELVIATKALVLDYLCTQYDTDFVIYLDTDIIIYDSFQLVEQELVTHNIILTPYACSSLPTTTSIENVISGFAEDKPFEDRMMLYVGIYNIGFIAVKNCPETKAFREWWITKCINQGFIATKQGCFGEQLNLNLVPIFFDKVLVLKDLGYNAAVWNLHERKFSQKNGKFYVNDTIPLVFYHFSGYVPEKPKQITKWMPTLIEERPDIEPLFTQYHQTFADTTYAHLRQQVCGFIEQRKQILATRKKKVFIEPLQYRILRRLLMYIPQKIKQDMKDILAD